MTHRLSAVALAMSLALQAPVAATWSIVAVDPTTREVGSAGASCTGYVAGIVGLAPGKGVIVAQAMSNATARRHGVAMLAKGASPAAVIAAIANLEFDPTFQLQQYGVAALDFVEAPATFTGTATHTWQGEALAPGEAVQGNMPTGPEVVADAMAAFQKDPSLPASRPRSHHAEGALRVSEANAPSAGAAGIPPRPKAAPTSRPTARRLRPTRTR